MVFTHYPKHGISNKIFNLDWKRFLAQLLNNLHKIGIIGVAINKNSSPIGNHCTTTIVKTPKDLLSMVLKKGKGQ
jgi:hypothetical protein